MPTTKGTKKRERPFEEKRINVFHSFEYIDCDDRDVVRANREWLLGGEYLEWKWFKDKLTGEIVLQRR